MTRHRASEEEPARRFARFAASLCRPDATDVGERITAAAPGLVPGCEQAALCLLDRHGGVVTAAATRWAAGHAVEIQRQLDSGPSLDAIRVRPLCAVDDLLLDSGWPDFSRRAARQTGIRSLLAVRLSAGDEVLGALTLCAGRPSAFATAAARAETLAAHAAVALAAAACRRRCAELDEALRSSRSIGIALGVVMAQRRVTSADAFAVLRRCAQRQHRKLREVAADIALTGEVPEDGRPAPHPARVPASGT